MQLLNLLNNKKKSPSFLLISDVIATGNDLVDVEHYLECIR